MMKPASSDLRFQHQGQWSPRRVVVAVFAVSLALWGLALAAILG